MPGTDCPFILDNSDDTRRVSTWLIQSCETAKRLDAATGHLEIGGLLALNGAWNQLGQVRILMGDNVSLRTKAAFDRAMQKLVKILDQSLEVEKESNAFLTGVDQIVEALRTGRIHCRVYRQAKFHAKAFIVHGEQTIVAAVGSSNLSLPGLSQNVELNVRLDGERAEEVAKWFEHYWDEAEDVTEQILQVVERQVQLYTPFEVYAKSLQQLFLGHEMTATEWETGEGPRSSRIYKILDQYQKDGYHALLKIAEKYRGAFLCDGVGLGKTFMGLMLIERLVVQERKNVCLLVPKAGRKPVWEAALARYLPGLSGVFGTRLQVYNHTDLIRVANNERDFPAEFKQIAAEADAFIIDEAHHFRNPGIAGEGQRRPSRYRKLFDICGDKEMYLLTATPVNNRLIDLQHMIELFSRKEPDYFYKLDPVLGIHSLQGHFRKMEKDLERLVYAGKGAADSAEVITDLAEAEKVLADDRLFRSLVVQRSRSYVKRSQEKHGVTQAIFPKREAPRVGEYKLRRTYGKLLEMVETAFNKTKPLFSLAIYNPESYPAVGAQAASICVFATASTWLREAVFDARLGGGKRPCHCRKHGNRARILFARRTVQRVTRADIERRAKATEDKLALGHGRIIR